MENIIHERKESSKQIVSSVNGFFTEYRLKKLLNMGLTDISQNQLMQINFTMP